jgi:hypothetical protein
MIEITGNHSKSIIFTRLLESSDTAGIIFGKEKFYLTPNKNIFRAENPTQENIYELIYEKLSDFKFIVIYSNYWESEIRPFIEIFRKLEKNNSSITFIVMYYKSNF